MLFHPKITIDTRLRAMRHITVVAPLAILAGLLGGPKAHGQSSEVFLVIGVGQNSCGQYLRAAEGERKARPAHGVPDGAVYTDSYGTYLDFTDGFLTGASAVDAYPKRMIGAQT